MTIVTVSRVHQHYHLLAKARPALFLIVAAVGFAFLQPGYLTRENIFNFLPMRLVLLLGMIACASAAFGISLGGSASFMLNEYAKTLAYSFLLAASVRNARDLRSLVWAYVIACGILSFFSLFVFGLSRSGGYVTRLNNLYTYDSNDVGVVLIVGLALTLLLLASARGSVRWILFMLVAGICATIARSGSRGGFLGFLAFGLAAMFLVNLVSPTRKILLAAGAGIALYVASPPGYWEQMQTILRPKQDYNFSAIDGRKALVQRGIGYMKAYPVFGLGINNFPRAECTISPKLQKISRSGPIVCKAPHNSYIQAGAETGVVGLVSWVWLLIGSIVSLLRLRRRLPPWWTRGTEDERLLYAGAVFFPLALIGFAVTAFFVSFAWMDTIYIVAALITGYYIALREHARHQSVAPPPTAESPGSTGHVFVYRERFAAISAVPLGGSR
jgi:O-antigen ligase